VVALRRGSSATALYTRLMGIGSEKVVSKDVAPSFLPLSVVLYYAYRKGFWPLLRGLSYRPRLRACGGRFFLGRQTNILFPSHLSVGHNVAIGDYVFMNCYGREGVSLGNNVRIREFGWVQVTSHLTNPGDGLEIGDDTYIGPHSVLGAGGKLRIGRDVTIGAYVQILAENHNFGDPRVAINEQGVTRRGITVDDGCWLGNSVIVIDGVHIGPRAVIGAGSVVTHDVPADAVAVGNPARVTRSRA
jgi:acetyltransferase-like isoleucine patch superfamily enzyme